MSNGRRALCALLPLLLLSACSRESSPPTVAPVPEQAACAAPAPAAVPRLQRRGRWLVDEHQRVVLLHGVNAVWKLDPFVPPDAPEGFMAADAAWLAEHGFNSARIGTLWVGVSPNAAGEVRADYLAAWDRIVQLMAAQKIWMLFDFHQDMLNHEYQGEGVPDWAVELVRGSFTSLLGAPTFGFPFNYFTPQLSQAYDNLWSEQGPVRDGFRDAWVAVADRWKNQPYSMGYNLFNEPWSGLEFASCLIPGLGCPTHDSQELQPFYEYALAGIRSVDANNMVWFESEPQGSSIGTPKGFGPVAGESQLGYSFHYYCPLGALAQAAQLGLLDAVIPATCDPFASASIANAHDQATRMEAVALMTEFGASDDLDVLRQSATAADAKLIGWQYWQYKNFGDPTTTSQGSSAQSLFTDDTDLGSVKLDKLRVLERAYPQATAGTPLELSFDPDTGAFLYRYQAQPASAPTEIHVPKLHYPNGYRIELSGARVVSEAGASRLLLQNLSCDGEVLLRLSPL
jgi:endoglycosylceramidase